MLVIILTFLAGFISMFVDNVVTILMMAPVALPLTKALNLKPVPVILMIGFGANFMGTALIIGDLPPQMLHSVAGAEFFDFIWHKGRPSSFPILMVTFLITLGAMYAYGFRGHKRVTDLKSLGVEASIPNPLFATVVVVWFLGTVIAMSMREHIGVQLGFIALTGAISLVLVLTLLGDRVKTSNFEEVMQELDWRAIFFYIALFALVGGLEKSHILDKLAAALRPDLRGELRAGRHAPLLGHDSHRRARRARRLYPDLPVHDQGHGAGRHRALAAVVDAVVVRHARQQPDRRRRAGAVCRPDPRGEGGRAQGIAARIPRVERAVHLGRLRCLLHPRHADLGAAVRKMR